MMFFDERSVEIGFLLVPNFPLITLSSALEVMRHANNFSGSVRYQCRTYVAQGATARASNGLEIQADGVVTEMDVPDMLFVCAGAAPQTGNTPETHKWLRYLARNNTPLGGISFGQFILASAGLLEDYRCTVHWEDAAVFRETFPNIELTDHTNGV